MILDAQTGTQVLLTITIGMGIVAAIALLIANAFQSKRK